MFRPAPIFCQLVTVAFVLALSNGAGAAMNWFRVETGSTNPALDPYWNDIDGNAALVLPNLSATTPLGDNVYLRINDTVTDDKIKIRNTTALNGTGSTTRLVMRMVSGTSVSNYGFEYRDTFGQITVTFRKNQGNNDGYIRLDDGGVEMAVPGITNWHVYWFVHAPGNMTYLWVDPTSADNSLATADLSAPGASSTDTRIGWGSESSGTVLQYDVDDVRWAQGVHLPSEDDTLPRVDTPTPTPTQTPSCTPTPTPTGTLPTPTNTVPRPPKVELTMLRQVGYYENQNFTFGLRVVYVHLADHNGNPLNGGIVRFNGSPQTGGVTGGEFGGFAQINLSDSTPNSFTVTVEYNGVTSDPSPVLYYNVPPHNKFYSWELNYRYRPDSGAPFVWKPQERTYDHARVQLNTIDGATDPTGTYRSDQFKIIDAAASNSYAQTFVANANRILEAKAFITTEFMSHVQYRATIHEGGPNGPQIGGAAQSPSFLSVEYPKITVFWPLEGPNAVAVVPGQTYAIKFTKVAAGTPQTFSVHHNVTNSYPPGAMYRDNVIMPENVDIVGVVVSAQLGGNPYQNDADMDGLSDCAEQPNLNLPAGRSNMLLSDSDGDGLLDGEEDTNLSGYQEEGETSTRNRDTDGDRYLDGIEKMRSTNPLMANAGYTDADNDELPATNDPNESNVDSDGDRYRDGYEAVYFRTFGAASNAGQVPPLGDGNRDGFVTSLDALIIQSLFLGLTSHTNPVFSAGAGYRFVDVNRDGFITSLDALVVQSFFLMLTPNLPI